VSQPKTEDQAQKHKKGCQPVKIDNLRKPYFSMY